MAVNSTAVWRVRTGGNAANGAGYDSAISGAGTDFSRQDAAQLAVADAATSGAGSTTLTSATGGFTAAMIGNAVKISGTNFQTGYYFITARTDTNTVTLDRTPSSGGAGSSGAARVGGAARQPENLSAAVAAGNTVCVRASAGNAASYPTSSLDYTISGFFTPTSGSTTAGFVRWVGENGVPTIDSPGLGFFNCTMNWLEGLYFVATATTFGTNGILGLTGGGCVARSCVVNQNLQAATVGIQIKQGEVIDCEVYGGGASPTASAGADGILTSTNGCTVEGNHVRHCRGIGINDATTTGSGIRGNLVRSCVGVGISCSIVGSAAGMASVVAGNTVHANGSDGIAVTGTAGIQLVAIRNNLLTLNGGYGLNVSNGTTALNDLRKRFCDYNGYGSGALANTSGARLNVSAGANDQSIDPGYANASGADFSVGVAAKALGFPGLLRGSSTTTYVDIGAAQRQEAAGGGATLFIPVE